MVKVKYALGPTPKICIIGAGFGGLTVAIQLKRKLGLETFTIYEKNCDLGGAWLVNHYPGAACDVPSNLYSWAFEVNPNWSHHFSKQGEILEYMRNTAKKYDLYSHLKVNTAVTSVVWLEKAQQWEVTTVDSPSNKKCVTYFEFVFISVGHLWNPNVPKIFEAFKGPKMHTALWDHSIDLKGKRVGVVGSGLSAIQVVPAIVKDTVHLHYVQRTPTWVAPKPSDIKFWPCFRSMLRTFPCFCKVERKGLLGILDIAHTFGGTKKNSIAQKTARTALKICMSTAARSKKEVRRLTKPGKEDLLLCRNFGTSNNYYQALCSDNVTVHRDNIAEVTADSIILENGTELKLDVLILATGFKTQEYFGPINVIGEGGVDIRKSWTNDRPRNYYGVCTTSAKNLFFTLAPQSIFLHTSAIFMIECQVNFAIRLLRHMIESNLKECQLKAEVEDTFTEMRDKIISKTVWGNSGCISTYPDGKGYNTFVFHGRAYDVWRALKKLDPLKFSFN